jgi:hypothetical protein
MNGLTVKTYADLGTANPAWHVAGTGDFNGDGKSDVTWHNNASGETIIAEMDGLTVKAFADVHTMTTAWHIVA